MKITFIRNFCFFTPHFIVFITLLYFSMSSASDRQQYLYFFDDPYRSTRFEYFFILLAKFFHFVGFKNIFSILLIQAVTLVLFFFTWNKLSITQNIISLSFFSIILFSVFSSILGVQIRYGFSVSIVLSLYALLREKNILYKIIYIIPALIHYGTIPFIILAMISGAKEFCGKTKLVFILVICSLSLVVITSNIFDILNIPRYYHAYFDGTFKNAPGPSLTMLYYFSVILINYCFEGKKVSWLPYFGFIFGTAASISGFDLLLKFLTPFVLLSTIDLFNHLLRIKLIKKVQTPFLYLLSFFSFLYFARMVGLY